MNIYSDQTELVRESWLAAARRERRRKRLAIAGAIACGVALSALHLLAWGWL